MILSLTVACIFVGVSPAAVDAHDEHWELFKRQHNKTYLQKQDVGRRAIFEANIKKINAHNLLYDLGRSSYRLGLNGFADMTPDEFEKYRGTRFEANEARVSKLQHRDNRSMHVPDTVDWRTEGYVTPVKNQGVCGSCWAFSTTGALEGQHFRRSGDLVSLSEQMLVDCSAVYGNAGCNGGLMDNAFRFIKDAGGLETEKSYPYTGKDGTCHFDARGIGAKLTGFVDVPSRDEEALKEAAGVVGPVSVAIDASGQNFQFYKDGVYDEITCSSTSLDHGVLVVGYGTTRDGKDYWLVKNSWGSSWGQSGYIQMSRNKENQCGIATMASYPTV
ncbi:cathepsin L1 [Galendromus occidentalis]|uniref:Cathepsin L1 n=1 Tax=Galendromus occidentalis TaxID=34638 RepID=A0AAJ6QNI3_9ACAR|nr:cathepsin L1 [Galendromus occidentalis]